MGLRRALNDGFELDDDVGRLDVEAVHAFVAEQAGAGRTLTRDEVRASIADSWRVVGLYRDARQVGFARAVSDGVTIAYLADVYVLEEHRGHGLGTALTRELLDSVEGRRLRWLLHTAHARDMYLALGFTELLRPRHKRWHLAYAPPYYPLLERDPVD